MSALYLVVLKEKIDSSHSVFHGFCGQNQSQYLFSFSLVEIKKIFLRKNLFSVLTNLAHEKIEVEDRFFLTENQKSIFLTGIQRFIMQPYF